MIGQIVGSFILIIVAVVMIGQCANAINAYTSTSTATWGTIILKMLPGFFALGILGLAIAVCYSSLKSAGIFEESNIEATEQTKQKQL